MSIKESLKNALILIAITVIAGLILGAVYETTKDTIAAREEADKKNAYYEVFPDATDFVPVDGFMTDVKREELNNLGFEAVTIDELIQAKASDGSVAGYVFTVTTSEGYGGDITLTAGIRNDGTLNGISILSINETAGLGMNAEKVLKPQFAGKKAQTLTYTKTGATSDDQIDAISGATITTNAFVHAVNCCIKYYSDMLN